MNSKIVVAGSNPTLVTLVCARLTTAVGSRFEVLADTTATGTVPPLCWVLLDPHARRPDLPACRVVDWTLLGAALLRDGPNDDELTLRLAAADDTLQTRIDVLLALLDVPSGPPATEFHASVRVSDLARSVAFYAWLFNVWPREWTHRYATFVRPELKLNFVLLIADGKALHHDTLYQLGIAQSDQQAIIASYQQAVEFGVRVTKPPRTTWRGMPLHELWLEDPDGTAIEIYARLSAEELARMPADQEPEYLVAGTAP